MRELDVLLERYLSVAWLTAPAEDRAAFAALLDLPDPELAQLCLGRTVSPEPALRDFLPRLLSVSAELSAATPVYPGEVGSPRHLERDP